MAFLHDYGGLFWSLSVSKSGWGRYPLFQTIGLEDGFGTTCGLEPRAHLVSSILLVGDTWWYADSSHKCASHVLGYCKSIPKTHWRAKHQIGGVCLVLQASRFASYFYISFFDAYPQVVTRGGGLLTITFSMGFKMEKLLFIVFFVTYTYTYCIHIDNVVNTIHVQQKATTKIPTNSAVHLHLKKKTKHL